MSFVGTKEVVGNSNNLGKPRPCFQAGSCAAQKQILIQIQTQINYINPSSPLSRVKLQRRAPQPKLARVPLNLKVRV